ncbi:MAG: CoA-binding protein [Candidatus Aenigmarchaeota archaeon]|nr:CoA-binding protein [Candidatus Aenigmarchaeota archaeon]
MLGNFFGPKSIAVIGVSRSPEKVGHVILRNLIDGGFKGKIFVVNPNAEEILQFTSYASITDVKDAVDLAIIAVPTEEVVKVVEQCGKKGIRDVIIVTSGFREVGNHVLDRKLEKMLAKYAIRCVGPNCLGCFDAHTKVDSLFLPRYRLTRPKEGGISFICQSGAVGSAILDLATEEGYGFAKFCSYGNAMNVDESDIMEYLGTDEKTKVICLYVEGIMDGKKFLRAAKKVSAKKPVIAIKGGTTEQGAKATLSHTGSLAGSAEIYAGAFRQAGVIQAHSLEEMFNYAKILEKSMRPAGDRVLVITNGGGYGILSTDAIVRNGLQMAAFSAPVARQLRKAMPSLVTIANPLDLVGDATTARYKAALDAALSDSNVDAVLLIVLYQTPLITTDIVDVIIEANDLKKKPIAVVSTGGEFTELLKKKLEEQNIPCYTFPEQAVGALRALVGYHIKK